ncbi:MAG TPA: right-handed parallel beta-helix repeat-containing protein [Xanthobacteraceae bacterium]|nr:right-handed parallel beta-helix repeat-containing protein [Xanthobacteraceae bacterium]
MRCWRQLIGILCCLAAAPALAATVDCDANGKLAAALAQAKAGTRILIRGLCRENLVLPPEIHDVTLDGGGKAAIVAPNERQPVLTIAGHRITVRGLGLAGGRNGIDIMNGASVVIDSVTVEDNGTAGQPGSGIGINIDQQATATILNATVRRNASVGILVQSSTARIGIPEQAKTVTANTIADNGGAGIEVAGGARADVIGATISRNKGDGIRVAGHSQLHAADNAIEGNDLNGITVTESSVADLGTVNGTVRKPNRTGPDAKDAAYGIACSLGAELSGARGTLLGRRGAMDLDTSCVDRSTP